jgi:hypothetical protein
MNVKNVLTVNAIYVFLIGLVSLFFPKFLGEANGIEITESTMNLQRAVGAVVFGYGLTSWLMRNAGPSIARRAYLIGGGLGYLVVAATFLFNTLSTSLGSINSWVYIIISLLFGVVFLYLAFGKDAMNEAVAG